MLDIKPSAHFARIWQLHRMHLMVLLDLGLLIYEMLDNLKILDSFKLRNSFKVFDGLKVLNSLKAFDGFEAGNGLKSA